MALREVESLAIHRTPIETPLVPALKNLHMVEVFYGGSFFAPRKRKPTAMRFNFGSVVNSPFQNSLQEKNIDKFFFPVSAIMLTA